jgi:major vault protein
LVLKSTEEFTDERTEKKYLPGEKWMLNGPCDYIPPINVFVEATRKATPLTGNEGLYVRNMQKGDVKLVRGPTTYMLNENEEAWDKELDVETERLIMENATGAKGTRAVSDGKGGIKYEKQSS